MDSPLLGAVEAIYAAAPDPALWPQALQGIAHCFDDFGANLIWQRDDGQFGVIVSPALEPAAKEYAREWWRHDIRAQRAFAQLYRMRLEGVTDRTLVTDHEIETHPFYTEFLAKHGLKWVASTNVSPDPRVIVGISIQRGGNKPPFMDADLALLTRIGRHAENALRLSIRLLDAELSNLGTREALSRLGIGVFALDSLGRVIFVNAAGERLLGDGLELVDGRLRATAVAAGVTFAQALTSTLPTAPLEVPVEPKPLLIERVQTPRPLTVYILPVASQSRSTNEFLTHVRIIVLVIDPQAGAPPDPAVVRDLLGLTLSEARVAALVGSGLGPREAAEKLGIAEETARTALKHVFSKVGVSRQSELTALLTRLVLR
jgi:DNA-binding CsgD family transcriptional regulator/PAS domain-containing protein